MCNTILNVICVGVDFLTFNVLLHIESERRVIGNWFCEIKIFKYSLKNSFSMRNILITICVGRDKIVIYRYFLFKKEAFNVVLKIIAVQI